MPEARPQEPTVSVLVLRGLIHVLEEAGVPRDSLLRGEQVEQLSGHDVRVPAATAERLCTRAMQLTGDAALGLHWAEHLSMSTFGPISHLCAAAQSLRHAFAVVSQYSALFSDEPFFELREHADLATIEILGFARRPPDVHRFAAELTVGGFVRIVRSLWAGTRFNRISFDYAAPSYRAEYRRVYKQPVVFGQAFTGLVFDRALLDAPSQYRDDVVSATISPLAARRLAQVHPSAAYTRRVRELLEQKAPERVTMEAIAQELGLSARSLRRRLRDENASYLQLENEVFGNTAAKLLPDSSIKEVAHRMGFSDAATFHRAFKRWTGTTPSAFQERRRGGA